MKRKLFVLTILLPLAILGAILPGQVIPRAHAAGNGLVCIAQITDVTNKCPAAPPIFNGPATTPNSLLRVPVMINNTDPFNGFDITLNSSDTSKLKPYGLDATGTLMPTGSTTLANCVAGVLISGVSCGAWENPTTVRLAIIGPSGFLAPQGTTGLLFTAIFSIAGNTTASGAVKISYQNKCNPISSSSGTLCVSVSNGSITPVPETVQTGGFDNSNAMLLPYATLSTTTINLGQSLVGAPAHALPTVTYTATSKNGFNTSSAAQLSLAASINGSGIRPTVSLSTASIDLTGITRQTFTQTGNVLSTVPASVYIASVTATYQAQDLSTLTTSSLSAAYPLPINVTDYAVAVSPGSFKILPPGSQPTTVTITPKASFNTLVNLGVTIPAATSSASISASYSATTISGGSGTSTLTITTTTNTQVGTYTITILSNSTLNGFTKTHTTVLTIIATGFTVTASPPGSQIIGTAETSTITVSYINGFTGTITLSNDTATNLSCLQIGQVSFGMNGTTTLQCNSLIAGTYNIHILATSGSRITIVTITFTFTFHDVAISGTVTVSPSGQAPVGTKITVNIQLQNKGPVDEQVLVTLLADSLQVSTPQNVTVHANTNLDVTLTWDSSTYAAKSYNLTITIQLSHAEINAESSQQMLSKTLGAYSLQPVSGSSPLDTTTIAIIAGAVVAVAAAGTVLIFRRRRTPSDETQPGTQ